MEDEYYVHLLHHRNDLLEQTADLINQEWPRSKASRIASIGQGGDDLPCSILLVTKQDEVVSHARLMPVAGRHHAALIESVIVPPDLRGRGLGRRVMEEAERYAASVGNETMHLSTHDKQGFYAHLGYTDGSRVTPLRRCVAKLANEQTEALLEVLEGHHSEYNAETEDKGSESVHVGLPAPPPTSNAAPPPPPPPPPQLKQTTLNDNDVITWMVKNLCK